MRKYAHAAFYGLRQARLGLIAQLMTMLASFLPIFFGLFEALVFIVQCSAIASILIGLSTVGAQALFPVCDDPSRELGLYVWSSITLSSLTAGLLALLQWTDNGLTSANGLWLAGPLLCAQSLYLVTVAIFVRAGDYRQLMRSRLYYAAVYLVGCLGLCLVRAPGTAFILMATGAFMLGSLPAFLHPSAAGYRLRSVICYALLIPSNFVLFARRAGLLVGYLLGGLATQLPSVLLPSLGEFAPLWAVLVRVSGGVQTVALQLVAPVTDIRLSNALREGDRQSVCATLGWGMRVGLLLALLTGLGSAVLGWTAKGGASATDVAVFGLAVIGFGMTSSFLGPINRSLVMAGGERSQLVWNAVRLLATLACFLWLSVPWLLVGLAVVGVMSAPAYAILVHKHASARVVAISQAKARR